MESQNKSGNKTEDLSESVDSSTDEDIVKEGHHDEWPSFSHEEVSICSHQFCKY